MKRAAAPGLDHDRLISASFAVLEADGFEKLSMRQVAKYLGVQAPAIYWHVRDKATLLGMMAREIYGRAYAAVPIVEDWRAWLKEFGLALRESLAGYRDGAKVCAAAAPSYTDPLDHAAAIARPLVDLGLDQETGLLFQAAVISFTLGFAMFEANGPISAFLNQFATFREGFEIGLQAIVTGLPTPELL